MQGIILFLISLFITYLISKFTNLKPTINYENKFEYIPIITSNIYADLFIIFITFSKILYKTKTINDWYKKYRLSAMIADILIGVLYILLARYIVFTYKINVNLFTFAIIAVIIQTIFDFIFYLFFSSIPKGLNHMLDFFKVYAKETRYNALLGDSILVLLSVILSAFFNQLSFDKNIIILLIGIYLIPYTLFMKD